MEGDVVFLHEVAAGAAGRSWGVHVAELAGVPAPVVRRAASLLAALEKHGGPLGAAGAPLTALPLFAAAPPRRRRNAIFRTDPLSRGARRYGSRPYDPARGARRTVSSESDAGSSRARRRPTRYHRRADADPHHPAEPPEASVAALSAALAALGRGRHTDLRATPRWARSAAISRASSSMCSTPSSRSRSAGLQAARLLGELIDGLITALYEHAMTDTGLGEPEHLSVAGTGGYGRGVLAPFSDIDLLFLTATSPRRRRCRWSNTCCISCGISV